MEELVHMFLSVELGKNQTKIVYRPLTGYLSNFESLSELAQLLGSGRPVFCSYSLISIAFLLLMVMGEGACGIFSL